MDNKKPSWQVLVPPKCCGNCGEPYSRERFEIKHVDADMELMAKEYRTWCKDCDSLSMDKGEEV